MTPTVELIEQQRQDETPQSEEPQREAAEPEQKAQEQQEAWPSPYERWVGELRRVRLDLRQAELDWAIAKENAKQQKSRVDSLRKKLLDLIDEGPQRLPLFDGPEEETTTAQSWRDVPLSELDIPAGILRLLYEADIETVGQLADYTITGKPLTSIAGIGEAKAERIEEALEKFWDDHPAGQPAWEE